MEEQIQTMVKNHNDKKQSKLICSHKLKEAKSLQRPLAAQNITIEMSMITTDMDDINMKIREYQRQIYFIVEEKKRQKKIINGLKEELSIEKQRKQIAKQITANIKEDVSDSVFPIRIS